jgi:hypothetical protein
MKDDAKMLMSFVTVIILVAILASLLTGCSYRLDTNGYYSKGVSQKAVKCVEVSSTYTKCSNK